MVSTKDIALVGGLVVLGGLIIYGGKELFKALNPLGNVQLPQLPQINISNPFNLSTPVNTTFPNADNQTKAFLESQNAQFATFQGTLLEFVKNLQTNLPPLGSSTNPANNPTSPTAIDVILNDPSLTDAQKRQALDIITPTAYSDLSKFNPPNVFGYGILGENKQGIPLSLAQQLGIESKNISQFTEEQKNLLSFINTKETFDVIKQGLAGVDVTRFLTAFSTKIEPNGSGEIVKISDTLQTSDRLTTVLNQNQQSVQTYSKPASGLFGGQVYLQTPNQFGGFVGGSINPNPVDTLTEVLSIFPGLTSSQASDVLREIKAINPYGLAPSTVKTIFPDGNIRNITTSPLDPPQIFNQSSIGVNLPASELFKLLYPNVQSDF